MVNPKKIIVVRPDAIGDVVLMIPMLNTIKKNFPDSSTTVLLQQYTKDILAGHPAVDKIMIDWKKAGKIKSLKHFFAYVKVIKNQRFDVVIFSYFSFFYALLFFLARVPIRIGDKNKILLRLFLNAGVKQNFRNFLIHETEQNIELLHPLKQDLKIDFKMNVFYEKEVKKKVEKMLQDLGWRKEKLIGIHPSSGGGNRAWLPQKYALLIDEIHKTTPYKIVLTGAGAKEQKIVAEIISFCKTRPYDLASKTNLKELKALISLCAVFIGTDTGPTHLASALSIPVLSIAPTKFVKPLRWGAWMSVNLVVSQHTSCRKICNPYKCKLAFCLESINPAYVLKRLNTLIEVSQKGFSLKNNKEEWFRASARVGFYVSSSESAILDSYKVLHEKMREQKIMHYFICNNRALVKYIKHYLGISEQIIEYIPRYRFFKLSKYIAAKDITILHPVPANYDLFWFFVRQYTALFMYIPPLIFNKLKIISGSENIIEKYKAAF